MVRLFCNIFKDNLNAVESLKGISWFWKTNWLIFEIFLLLFIIVMMIGKFLHAQATEESLKGITFNSK
jgi:SSS family solute:Na+ symporter